MFSYDANATAAVPPRTVWRLLLDARTWPTWSPLDELVEERSSSLHADGTREVGAVQSFRTGTNIDGERITELVPERRMSYEAAFNGSLHDYRASVERIRSGRTSQGPPPIQSHRKTRGAAATAAPAAPLVTTMGTTMNHTESDPTALLTTANRIITQVIDAFASRDANALVALMTTDIELTHSLSPTPLTGTDQVRAFYRTAVFGPMPDVTIRLVDGPFLHPSAPRFALAWVTEGTAVVPTQGGEQRRTVETAVREVAELEGDLVSRLSIVADHASLMRQLGAPL